MRQPADPVDGAGAKAGAMPEPSEGAAPGAAALGAPDSGVPARDALADIAREPWRYDFYAALRLVEATHPERPRLGTALRPAEEPLRLGQSPELSFAPAPLAGVAAATAQRPPRIDVRFFGLFGPNGPLPLHLTDHARQCILQGGDHAFARFADLFHHRLLLLFYRAWAQAQPTVSLDRPGDDRFADFVGSLIGIGFASQRDRDAAPDAIKRRYAGHFSNPVRSAEGLQAIASGYLGRPVAVECFVGRWLVLPVAERSRIGGGASRRAAAALGAGAVLGAAVWDRQHNFRLHVGPLDLAAFESLLPGGAAIAALVALVALYCSVEFGWDLRLELAREDVPACRLGRYGRLGWTTWVGREPHVRNVALVLEPAAALRTAARTVS